MRRAVAELTAAHPPLAAAVERYGPPPMWTRRPGYATLCLMILEQQVSLVSARAVYTRLKRALGSVTAHKVARTTQGRLRRLGLTRQKARYVHELAHEVVDGELDLRALARAPDAAVRERLCALNGIGPWTADCFLLFTLGRPDVWPPGDVALAEGARQVLGLRERPDDERLTRLARRWAPWRSVAARLLWHHYLSERRAGR